MGTGCRDATAGQVPDKHGQLHPVETPELIERKQKEFALDLANIPDKSKKQVLIAMEKCPELLTDDFKLMFLRCEVFNSKLAAKRFVTYWNKRVEIFGDEKAFKPLTLESMDSDDLTAGKFGIGNAITRPGDRSIWYFNSTKLHKSKFSRMNIIRIAWYMLHIELELSIVTQQKGMVFISYARNIKVTEWDPKLEEMLISSVQGSIPIRISAVHICHPPAIVFSIIWPIVQLFLSKRLRKRIKVHGGTDESVTTILQKDYNINIDDIPCEMGGKRTIDMIAWFEERVTIESTDGK